MSVGDELAKPLDPGRVKKREGSGKKQLSYIEGHYAWRRANEIFGFGGWSTETTELTHLGTEPTTSSYGKEGFKVAYRARVRVTATVDGEVTSHEGTGYGDGVDYSGSQLTPHELACKEAETDAMKRALVHFGDQFGASLYAKDAPEHQGRWAERPEQPPVKTVSWKQLTANFEELGVRDPGGWMNRISTEQVGADVKGLTVGARAELLPRMVLLFEAVSGSLSEAEVSLRVVDDASVQRAVARVFDGLMIEPPVEP